MKSKLIGTLLGFLPLAIITYLSFNQTYNEVEKGSFNYYNVWTFITPTIVGVANMAYCYFGKYPISSGIVSILISFALASFF